MAAEITGSGEKDSGFIFKNKVSGNELLSAEIVRAIETGLKDASEVGFLAGYPLVDTLVELKSVDIRPDQINPVAFKIAAAQAFRDSLKAAQSQLLEPIFRLEITTPDESTGNIIGDLNARRGKVNRMDPKGDLQVIKADAPLASLFGYATDVRSLSQGRASFSMEFKEYAPLPPRVEKEILTKLGR